MIDFSGWLMPIQYHGIIEEHHCVRRYAGLFDVSHMGRIMISGLDAERFIDYLSTNKIAGKENFTATYTVWANEHGGCVDDVIVYKLSSNEFFAIVNAANRQKDLEHLQKASKGFNVVIENRYSHDGILSIQGPNARKIASLTFTEASELKHMRFSVVNFKGLKGVLSCTGYTGEDGFEIYAPNSMIVSLWELWLEAGKLFGICPIGLGARDSLRLEKGYALYGHEISEAIAPTESVSAWTLKWQKPNFLGKQALENLEKNPEKRSEFGIILSDPGVARQDYEVFQNKKRIGIVTSGGYSPSLNKSIAIVLAGEKLKTGDQVEVKIRQNLCKAKVVDLPFVS